MGKRTLRLSLTLVIEALIFFLLLNFHARLVGFLDLIPRNVLKFLLGPKQQWLGSLKYDLQVFMWFTWFSVLLPLIVLITASITSQRYLREPQSTLDKAYLSKRTRFGFYTLGWYKMIVDVGLVSLAGGFLNFFVSTPMEIRYPALISIVIGSWFIAAISALIVVIMGTRAVGVVLAVLAGMGMVFVLPDFLPIGLLRYGCLQSALNIPEYLLTYAMVEGIHLIVILLKQRLPRIVID